MISVIFQHFGDFATIILNHLLKDRIHQTLRPILKTL